jgi:hypothetical protein
LVVKARDIAIKQKIKEYEDTSSNSKTKRRRKKVASDRGSGTSKFAYTTRKILATVVNSDDVDEVVQE